MFIDRGMTLTGCAIYSNAAASVRDPLPPLPAAVPYALGLVAPQRPAPSCTRKRPASASLCWPPPCVGACRTLRLCGTRFGTH